MADLYVNLPRRILDTLKTALGTDFRVYFDGDPVAIGSSQLPCIVVDWDTAEGVRAPTGHDKWRHTIIIKVVLNKMDDVNVMDLPGDGSLVEVPTKKRLEQVIFGRDATTREYNTDTVLGVLRRNFSMGGRELSQEPTVEFGISQRPGDAASTVVTSEGHIRIVAEELIQVTGRT